MSYRINDGRSYDDKQIEAILTRCPGCGGEFYMTAPAPLCVRCTDKQARAARAEAR